MKKTVFTRDRHGRIQALVVGASALMGATASHAAVDVSDATTAINDAQAPVTAIGTAVLGVLVVVAVFKWARRAF